VTWEHIVGFLQIVLIDLALSGDNALVIGMAAASLPRSQRTRAIVVGGACAILLRIALTSLAAFLIRIPALSAVAGAFLFWVAWKLLKLDVSAEEPGEEKKARQVNNFRQAILLILTADLMMSIDNVLSVAGAAHGNEVLLILGLLISMPLLMTTGSFISRLIDKFKWIPFVGAAVICFTATRMILEDQFVEKHLELYGAIILAISVAIGLIVPCTILLINKLKAR
jgi:YjbE family integral membrane protein